jgi:uncharacterized repeat protein (TIGR01451 family)
MNDSSAGRRVWRSLLTGLLAGLSLFVLFTAVAVAPLAAQEDDQCHVTTDGGASSDSSVDANALRDAIASASPGDTIWVAGTCRGVSEDDGTTQVARISMALTIVGYDTTWTEPAYAEIDAEDDGRVFYVNTAGPVTFGYLRMVNGNTTGSGGAIYSSAVLTIENSILEANTSSNMGGAIVSYADLTIRNTQLIDNTSVHRGGAIAARGSGNDLLALESVEFTGNSCTNAGGCFGGALSTLHAVTMTDTWFVGNHTTGSGFASGGGAIYSVGELTISDSHFLENVSDATGGALYTYASLSVTDSEFKDNGAELDGGAIWMSGPGEIAGSHLSGNSASSGTSRGGAILNNGALTVSATEIYSNSAYHGGGIYNTTSSVLSIGGGSEVGWNTANIGFGSGGGVRNEGTLTVANSLFNNNRSSSGGAIATNNGAQVQQTVLANNEARSGGAIAHSGGTSTIEDATFSSNRSFGTPSTFEQPGGGAISMSFGQVSVTGSSFSDNQAIYRGGAIYNSASFSANLMVEESEITGNSAAYGGGLYVREDTTVARSRLVDNTATDGGAIAITGQADVVLTNNFLAGNHASGRGATIYFDDVGTQAGTLDATHNTFVGTGAGTAVETNGNLAGYDIGLTNVIFSGYATAIHTAGITDTVTVEGVLWHDVPPQTTESGITVSSAVEGDPAFLDPSSHDYHLLPASAAIDQGVDTSVDIDIDGDARPQGLAPDLGADELTVLLPDLVVRKTATPNNPTAGSLVTYDLTFRNAGVGVMVDVVVSDVLPASLEIVSITSADITIEPGLGTTWVIGDLDSGEGGTITIVTRVRSNVAVGTEITNEATISGTGEEATLVNNTASVTVTVGPSLLYLPLIVK